MLNKHALLVILYVLNGFELVKNASPICVRRTGSRVDKSVGAIDCSV